MHRRAIRQHARNCQLETWAWLRINYTVVCGGMKWALFLFYIPTWPLLQWALVLFQLYCPVMRDYAFENSYHCDARAGEQLDDVGFLSKRVSK